MHVSKTIRKIKLSFVSYVKILRKSLRKKIGTCECSSKKGVLRNFTKFTEKHLCRSLFFSKVAGLRPATLLKKRLCLRPATYSEHLFYRTPLDDFFCALNMPRYFTFHISLQVLCDN